MKSHGTLKRSDKCVATPQRDWSDSRFAIPALRRIRKLRNRAAHEAFFEVTQREIEQLTAKTDTDPKDLYQLCVVIFATLWNNHIDEFVQYSHESLLSRNDANHAM